MVSVKNILYLQNLIAIAAADGRICDREMVYLRRKAHEFGFSEPSVRKMIENASEFQLIPPFGEDSKLRYLGDCVDMVLADGVVNAAEMERCMTICKLIGVSESHLHNLIATKKITVL